MPETELAEVPTPGPGKALVLCVDDEMIHLTVLQNTLGSFCDVLCASNVADAGVVLAHSLPDIILLDVGLPDQSGYELCAKIRGDRTFDSTRIIMISAYSHISDRLKAYAAGADDYVMKPFSEAEIAAKVRVFHRLIAAERLLLGNKHALEHLLSESVQELKKKFTVDEETGFPNGLRFSVDLRRTSSAKTVVLLNINSFNRINEAFGFNSATAILRSVAERLKNIANKYGYPIYRMRGADFALLIDDQDSTPQGVAEFVADIQRDFSVRPVRFEDFEVRITFNAGIALNEVEEPLKKAALSLTYSKKFGPGQHGIFSEFIDVKDKYEENFTWGKIVKTAVSEGGIVPYFQGIYSNRSGWIEKYECLVRIQGKSGVYTPQQFLPAAAKLGLMTSITREMIQHCFAYFQNIASPIQFAINITDDDLLDEGFLSFVERKLRQYSIEPGQVIFEIVETASIAGRRAMRNLEGLKKIGCLLALDDFGTENSNFARILNLKVDFIKIDGRFVADMHRSQQSFIVAKTITDFAHSIGAKAVAEFVHCPEVQWKIAEIGADYSQGYLIHQPAPEIAAH